MEVLALTLLLLLVAVDLIQSICSQLCMDVQLFNVGTIQGLVDSERQPPLPPPHPADENEPSVYFGMQVSNCISMILHRHLVCCYLKGSARSTVFLERVEPFGAMWSGSSALTFLVLELNLEALSKNPL